MEHTIFAFFFFMNYYSCCCWALGRTLYRSHMGICHASSRSITFMAEEEDDIVEWDTQIAATFAKKIHQNSCFVNLVNKRTLSIHVVRCYVTLIVCIVTLLLHQCVDISLFNSIVYTFFVMDISQKVWNINCCGWIN